MTGSRRGWCRRVRRTPSRAPSPRPPSSSPAPSRHTPGPAAPSPRHPAWPGRGRGARGRPAVFTARGAGVGAAARRSAAAQLGAARALRPRRRAHPPRPGRRPTRAGRGRWSGAHALRHRSHRRRCGGPARRAASYAVSFARPTRAPLSGRAAPPAAPRWSRSASAPAPPGLAPSRATAGGPAHLSPVRVRVEPRPQTAGPSPHAPLRRTRTCPAVPFARLGALPAATAAIALSLAVARERPRHRHPVERRGRLLDRRHLQRRPRLRGVAHHEDRDPGPRVGAVGDRRPATRSGTSRAPSSQLDEPVTDAHGNEVTERTASVVYTATTPLPDGQRDTFELSFQLPDAEGEMLDVPDDPDLREGRDRLDRGPGRGAGQPRAREPGAGVRDPARRRGGRPPRRRGGRSRPSRPARSPVERRRAGRRTSSPALGWAGLGAGLLGLVAGGLALARTRSTS